jgi:hypothetical protein
MKRGIFFLVTWGAGSLAMAAAPANLVSSGRVLVAEALPQPGAASHPIETPRWPLLLEPDRPLLVEWDQPREVHDLELEFEGPAPAPEAVGLEWWHRIWPDNGTGGWMKLDDPFNGHWVKARTTSRLDGSRLRLGLTPLLTNEVPGLQRSGFDYRRTYKVRLTAGLPLRLTGLAVHSDAETRRARLRFEWNCRTTVAGTWSPRFEARNGRLLAVTPAGQNSAVVDLEYCSSINRLSADRGMVLFRSGEERSFAVFVDDVLREGGLWVRDIGAFVSDAERTLTFASWPGPAGPAWKEGTVLEQVARLPEQSFERVRQAIPLKPVPYLLLGVPNMRQEFALGPKGDIRLLADSLRSPGTDAERRPWTWRELCYQFASGEQPGWWRNDRREVQRSLEEGWLPVVRHAWNDGEIAFVQSSLAAPLLADIARLESRTGTEPLALLNRVEMRNLSPQRRTARLWLALNHPGSLRLETNGWLALAAPSEGANRPGLTPLRGRLNTGDRGVLAFVPTNRTVCYSVELEPGQTHALELALTYLELLDAREVAAIGALSFDQVHPSVTRFWRERVSQGMTCQVPDLYLNEFFKASLWHALISTDIDPVTGHHQHGAATHHYKNYLNETAMVARSLEMRGEHEAARLLLEPFLACQGVKGLPGNFRTREGVLYAACSSEPDPYTAQGYNMHHGFGLWAAAEHFFWSRDTNWLRRVAPNLIQGCEWIARERQATKTGDHPASAARQAPGTSTPAGARASPSSLRLEYGLPPAGDLEDVEEYLYWYATSAYYYLGMKTTVDALAASGLFQGRDAATVQRWQQEAEAFRHDIQSSVAEAVATTPVVRLRDGTWIPYVPPRPYALTHLSEGWIREGLYPALHLVMAGVYPDNHPYTDWMLQEQEDNIFLSCESGYGIENPRANFFHRGGFTLQPNLVDLPLVYLRRDQVPNFLRGFYNTAWASLYPETVCFAEWVPSFGQGGGPLFKTPDEAKFIQWMRQMLVLERDGALELGMGVPRAWMRHGQRVNLERAATFFGRLDLDIQSQASQGVMRAHVRLRKVAAPSGIVLRLRHPEDKLIRSAEVNGKPARVNPARQVIELPLSDLEWDVTARF